jgi:serine/threonine protein kinase
VPAEVKIRIPLSQEFRYFHEPVSGASFGRWAVGRNELAQEFADRIVLSRGGAFLVGGLRGVGKTTFVQVAMHAIRSSEKRYAGNVGKFELVDVWLNISRTMEPVQLLHLVIRHLYLRLKEMGLLDGLDAELRRDLHTAFMRTSFEISSRAMNQEERGRSSEVGFSKAPWIGIEFLGKLSASYKRTRSDEEALKYLPYDEKAAEFDIVNFARRLQEGRPQHESWWRRLLGKAQPTATPIRVVFVLDELDKLERQTEPSRNVSDAQAAAEGTQNAKAADAGVSVLDPILQALKTVFSASGFSFVFVGGKEVEERLIEDISHADSIYESIFAYNLYLPCLWEDQGEILAQCMASGEMKNEIDPYTASYQETVARYLRYKGRGIPRRTWREVNKYVWWEEDGPKLILDVKSRRYMDLFSKLEEGLHDDLLFQALERNSDNVRRDRQKLYFYYTADWVLGRGRETFTSDDVVAMTQTLNLGGKLTPQAATAIAQTTLEILKNRACIETESGRTVRADAPWDSVYYRLSPWVLRAFEGSAEEEVKAAVAAEVKPQQGELTRVGWYQVLEEIGGGATSQIFKVRGPSGEVRAAKVLRTEMAQSTMMASRFRDEIAMLKEFQDKGIVQVFDSGEEDGRPYLVMELLEGVALDTLIRGVKVLPVGTACYVAAELAAILGRIHAKGWIHRDVKPGNIFVTSTGGTKLMDFGIGRSATRESGGSRTGEYILGTPGYMAPEQILNPSQAGAVSDVYSLAVTLFEMITGQLPFGSPEQLRDWRGLVEDAPPLQQFAAVPEALAETVARALARDPERRTQTMEAFRAELVRWQDPSASALAGVVASCRSSVFSSSAATLVGFPPTEGKGEGLDISEAPTLVSPAEEVLRGGAQKGVETPQRLPWKGGPKVSAVPPPPPVSAPYPMPQAAPAPAVEVPAFVSPAAALQAKDLEWLWNGSRAQQDEAFQRLSVSSGTLHLLFDFARKVCLWGGPGATSRSLILREGRLILGRSASEVDLPLEAKHISRQHLAFFVRFEEEGIVQAEDLSSASGSQVNGERLSRRVLKDGDKVQAGECEIRVHLLPRNRTLIAESPERPAP